MAEKTITYLAKAGPSQRKECIRAAAARAKELDVKHVVVATTSGRTALEMAAALKKIGCRARVLGVGYSSEYAAKWGALKPSVVSKAEKLGVAFITGTHIMGGIDSAVSSRFGGVAPGKLIAEAFYTLGQGFKVAVEVSVMALDQGKIPAKTEIIALGGTGAGADTAIALTPENASQFFALKIHEVIALSSRR
jgi:hypothetical protein